MRRAQRMCKRWVCRSPLASPLAGTRESIWLPRRAPRIERQAARRMTCEPTTHSPRASPCHLRECVNLAHEAQQCSHVTSWQLFSIFTKLCCHFVPLWRDWLIIFFLWQNIIMIVENNFFFFFFFFRKQCRYMAGLLKIVTILFDYFFFASKKDEVAPIRYNLCSPGRINWSMHREKKKFQELGLSLRYLYEKLRIFNFFFFFFMINYLLFNIKNTDYIKSTIQNQTSE